MSDPTPAPRLLYAHRGANRHAPENTLPAFARGLADGANALELDVHLTRDGEVVVAHDPDGRRIAGNPGRIVDLPLADVQRWDLGGGVHPATFREVLEAFPEVPLNVDLKSPAVAAVRPVVELVTRLGAAKRVRLTSFHDAVVSEVRRLGYPGPTGLSMGEVRRFLFFPWGFVVPTDAALQVPTHAGPLRFDTRRVIDRAHRAGLRVDYWVVNSAEEARRLFALGADGVISDDPASLKGV